jgi:hypothetical protein
LLLYISSSTDSEIGHLEILMVTHIPQYTRSQDHLEVIEEIRLVPQEAFKKLIKVKQ